MAKVGEDYTYRKGMHAETRVAITTKSKVFSFIPNADGLHQIGVMSSFGISDSRSVEPVRGIGYGDQIAELVPGVSEPIALSVERAMLYLAQMMQIFGYNAGIDGIVRALKHHRWPFDIMHELSFSAIATREPGGSNMLQPSSDGCNQALVTLYEACWMNSYSTTFAADTTIVTESCEISVSDVMDVAGQGYVECADTGNALRSRRFGKNQVQA